MSATTKVTRRQASEVLAQVRKVFGVSPDESGPTLDMEFDWLGYGASPAVVWEEGPYEWALTASAAQYGEPVVNEELASLAEEFGVEVKVGPLAVPDGLYVEPLTSWALGIYRR